MGEEKFLLKIFDYLKVYIFMFRSSSIVLAFSYHMIKTKANHVAKRTPVLVLFCYFEPFHTI